MRAFLLTRFSTWTPSAWSLACVWVLVAVGILNIGCVSQPAALTQLLEARQLAAELRVEFATATDAANRAVMAESDQVSAAAADQARQARRAVRGNLNALLTNLQLLNYSQDIQVLERFQARFAEYERLDDAILGLAVENTNLKAQRLSFGPGREAADAFRAAIDGAVKIPGTREPWHSEALATRAIAAVLQIQVLQAPHIAEADAAAMTRMEGQMAALHAEARAGVQQLKATLPPAANQQLGDALAALDRFSAINEDLVVLSRRNSEVHSLALSLGQKRTLTASCQDQLQALAEVLARHEFGARR